MKDIGYGLLIGSIVGTYAILIALATEPPIVTWIERKADAQSAGTVVHKEPDPTVLVNVFTHGRIFTHECLRSQVSYGDNFLRLPNSKGKEVLYHGCAWSMHEPPEVVK